MPLGDLLTQLQKFCLPLHPLKEIEWTAFSAIWQKDEAKSKTILTAQGETEQHLYFITEGGQCAKLRSTVRV